MTFIEQGLAIVVYALSPSTGEAEASKASLVVYTASFKIARAKKLQNTWPEQMVL